MTFRPSFLPLALSGLLLSSCGYIGDPLPPSLNIPLRISDLTATQRGDKLRIHFTPTLESTDHLTLKSLSAIELRAGPAGPPPFDTNVWSAQARAIPVPVNAAESTDVEAPITGWAGSDIVMAVRTIGPTGRPSEWSNLVVLKIYAPLQVPEGIRTEPRAATIHLSWNGGNAVPGAGWRILRRGEKETEYLPAGKSTEPQWDDPNVQYGNTYSYVIQKTAPAGGSAEAESELSRAVVVTYRDQFAPAVPSGLTAIAGIKSIEVAWISVPAPDLKGYQVYRSTGESPFAKLGDTVTTPSLSDRAVEPGTRYRYRVTAIDQLGNESAPSDPVDAVAPN